MICTSCHILLIIYKRGEMHGTCRKYGGEEKCIKVIGREARKETTWKPRLRWSIILKMVLKK
jgi:hypothetical protein